MTSDCPDIEEDCDNPVIIAMYREDRKLLAWITLLEVPAAAYH